MMRWIRRTAPWFFIAVLVFAAFSLSLRTASATERVEPTDGITLVRAVICEGIEDFAPKHVAVAFSIDVGKISCYTAFEGLSGTTYTLHKWFRRDALVTSKRLTLKPPRWATYSSIQLREGDKGPWRVEIYNADDELIETLRFSVTD
jgi:Protein of unknown function (DUF2914)